MWATHCTHSLLLSLHFLVGSWAQGKGGADVDAGNKVFGLPEFEVGGMEGEGLEEGLLLGKEVERGECVFFFSPYCVRVYA